MLARCVSDTSFEITKSDNSKETVEFNTLGCSAQYREDFIKTGTVCGGNSEGELVKVYRITICKNLPK